MKKTIRFLREYRLFGAVVVTAVVGLGLELGGWHTAAHWLLGSVTILEALPLLWDMWQDVRSGKYGIDILAATAIITSVILGQYWAAVIIVLMLTGGEALEDYAEHRARAELDSLLTRAPQKARVLRKGKTLEVRASDIIVGDKVIIRPGEIVPVDAVVLEGSASFDESSLTGESLPQVKNAGEQILSGSINIDGAIMVKALHSAADSQYQQIIKLVRSAANSQAPFVRLADRYSIPFTIAAYAMAIGVWVLSGQAIRFLEVIVVATPCPLLLAAPIALISGMSRASKYGIIVKTGSALERLAETRTMAFDKTGTLTRGELKVAGIAAYNGMQKDEVLALAASLEQNSNHVLARAVVQEAKDKQLKLSKAKHLSETSGRGLRASIKSQEVLVGRLSFMEEHGVALPSGFKSSAFQQTAAYVSVDGKLAGVLTFKDELRSESAATLKALREMGIDNILMVTGDNSASAQAIAEQLGITEVRAEALPADKLTAIEAVKNRPVAFVGDGVNDAPVLTASDVGIALGARGSTAASESADLVIMKDDLTNVAHAVAIAKRTFSIARQSILVGIGLSVGLMLMFATGHFPPLLGALLQEVVDVVVIFNALRAHTGTELVA